MLGRAQVGIGLAGLALTAAVLANCSLLTGFFIALSVLFLVATAANRLPWLHTWPLVGAPKVAVRLKLDGRTDLRLGIRRLPEFPVPDEIHEAMGGSGEPAFEARTAHLEIGVDNTGRSAIPGRSLRSCTLRVCRMPKRIRTAATSNTASGCRPPMSAR